jgi:CheY-like chemotaxis protein
VPPASALLVGGLMAPPLRLHILIVDDDPAIRKALATGLGPDYRVHAAATGDEACAILAAAAPSGTAARAHSSAAPPGAPLRGFEFEHSSGSVLSVTGQGTGLQYRFVGYSARVSVDSRDRASLARVPQLREVKPHNIADAQAGRRRREDAFVVIPRWVTAWQRRNSFVALQGRKVGEL